MSVKFSSASLFIMSTFACAVYAGKPSLPDISGTWSNTEFKELAGRHMDKMNNDFDKSFLTGKLSAVTIKQKNRIFLLNYTFELSEPVVGSGDKTKWVNKGAVSRLCAINYDNVSFQCFDRHNGHYVFGIIDNSNKIGFTEGKSGIHDNDPYVLDAVLVRNGEKPA